MWLIDADKLMEYCRNQKIRTVDCNDIARFPTIDAKPVIHGRWTRTKDLLGEDITVCSNCDEIMRQVSGNYCAYCGADMWEETNND